MQHNSLYCLENLSSFLKCLAFFCIVHISGAVDTNEGIQDGPLDDSQNVTLTKLDVAQNTSALSLAEGQNSPQQPAEGEEANPPAEFNEGISSELKGAEEFQNSKSLPPDEELSPTSSISEEITAKTSNTVDPSPPPGGRWGHVLAGRYLGALAAFYVIICVVMAIRAGPIFVR